MKRIGTLIVLLICMVCFVGCDNKKANSSDIIRIHIRANSNDEKDQSVKLLVRDKVVDFITPLLAECENKNEVKNILKSNLINIQNIANSELTKNNYLYGSNVYLNNEFFPTRCYKSEIYPADYYDALIVELGSAEGDNWWCVAYPPLCFVGNDVGSNGVVYKSKLIELINNFFGG